ncbi:MAG: glycosyltransferase family 4 protein [Pseudomonadota bacterium]
MRILTLSYEYPPVGGGGATVCQGLAESLVDLGHQIDVVTSAMDGLPDHEEQNGVNIYRVPCWRRHQYYSTAPELLTTILPSYRKALELARSHAYDLAHCHFVVPTGVVAYLLQHRIGLPYVLTCHGSDVPGYNPDRFSLLHPVIAPFWRRIVAGSVATTSPSTFLESLVKKVLDRPVDIIPNFFDARPVERLSTDRRRVLVVSRLVKRKGVDSLIDAMAELPSDWELVVAGDGPCLPDLRRQAAARDLRARFLGHVARNQLDELYASAAIFALPSLQENFPMTLLEAMAAGCAVVTTRTEGCVEVVGDAAALIKPGSVDDLRAKLWHLMEDEGACAALGRQGLERVKQFSSAAVVEKFQSLFHRCADAHLGKLSIPTARPVVPSHRIG